MCSLNWGDLTKSAVGQMSVWPLGHFLMFAQWPFEISVAAINSQISMGPLCAFPALCKSVYIHPYIYIYVYRHVVMHVLPISPTFGSLSSPVCTNRYLLFTLRLSVARGQSVLLAFLYCDRRAAPVRVSRFGYRDRYWFGSQVQIILLCITISPNAFEKN